MSKPGSSNGSPQQETLNLVIHAIQNGESTNGRLDAIIRPGVQLLLARKLPASQVHPTTLCIIRSSEQAIRDGLIRSATEIVAFVRDRVKQAATGHWPLQEREERSMGVMRAVLGELSEHDLSVLRRFYLCGQSATGVCSEFSVSLADFDSLRSRVRDRFRQLQRLAK